MTRRPRLLYLSDAAVPYQIKFCDALQKYFYAEFWFYESAERVRGRWWNVELGSHCKILDKVFVPRLWRWVWPKYVAFGVVSMLERFDPDIVVLAGLSIPGNMFVYLWAKRHGKKTILFSERSRSSKGKLRGFGLVWRLLRWFYRDVDMVIVSADDAVVQFRDTYRFGEKVIAGRYAADLESYFAHQYRSAKPAYTYLFANRLTEIYNPMCALGVFCEILRRYPGSRLIMNASGDLLEKVQGEVARLGLVDAVEFLTDISSWSEMHRVYERSDILLLPAIFSNGNFTILEAMASGMGLVVSNRVLGNGKLCIDGINGFSCEPSESAFLERIEHYIGNPTLFSAHAKRNREIVRPLSTFGTAEFFANITKPLWGLEEIR